jgi:hypothetical protein
MAISDRIEVKDLARREFKQRLGRPVRTHDGGWVISFRDQPSAVVLDGRLNEVLRLDVPADAHIAAGRAGPGFAVLTKKELRVLDPKGTLRHAIPQRGWQPWAGTDCAIDGHDRVWYARPGDKPGTNDCLVIVDPTSGATVAEERFENDVGFFALHACLDPDSMLVEVSCGQDGSFLYHAAWTGSKIAIQPYPFEDRSFSGGFSPDGREFVSGSHEGDGVQVHGLPDGRVVASIDSEAIFGEDQFDSDEPDEVGYEALFLSNERILIDTHSRRLVLIDRPSMEVLGCVWPEGYDVKADDNADEDDAAEACSYHGSLDSFHFRAPAELLVVFDGGLIRLLDVSSALR